MSGKNGPLNKMLEHAQYITQSNSNYTSLSNTQLGTVWKISMNCVSCVVIFFLSFRPNTKNASFQHNESSTLLSSRFNEV